MDNEFVKERYYASMTSKEQVYVLLERAVSHMTQAKEAFLNGSFEKANESLIGAQEIFHNLRGCLRSDDEASRHGAALLDLLIDELFYINLNKELDRLEEVKLLTTHLQINYGAQLGKLRFE